MMDSDPLITTDPLRVPGVTFSTRYVAVAPDVELHVMHWQPPVPAGPPILFVAGWVSVVEGWADLLRALVPRHEILYLESREKASARLLAPKLTQRDFAIERLSADLLAACDALGIDTASTLVMGSSLGATAILEALKHGRLSPHGAFLVGPTCTFRFPIWGHALVRLPTGWYRFVRHIVIWYLRHFRVDAHSEPEQMRRYEDTLMSAVPARIKLSAIAAPAYEVWPDLETIGRPVAVAHAASDSLHVGEDITRLLRALPHGRDIPCASNKYMHRAPLARDVEAFLECITGAAAVQPQQPRPGYQGEAL